MVDWKSLGVLYNMESSCLLFSYVNCFLNPCFMLSELRHYNTCSMCVGRGNWFYCRLHVCSTGISYLYTFDFHCLSMEIISCNNVTESMNKCLRFLWIYIINVALHYFRFCELYNFVKLTLFTVIRSWNSLTIQWVLTVVNLRLIVIKLLIDRNDFDGFH